MLLVLRSLHLLKLLLLPYHSLLLFHLLEVLLLLGLGLGGLDIRTRLLVSSLLSQSTGFLLLLLPSLLSSVLLNLLLGRWRRLSWEIRLLPKLHLSVWTLWHSSHHRVHSHA